MASYHEPEYFSRACKDGRIVVKEAPKFDLEAYIANYEGRTRFDRLFLIGTSSVYLHLEALKAAIEEAKRGKNVGRYESAVHVLQELAPRDPDAELDHHWIEKTTRQVKAETERLETELKGYKNNLIKESIRMAYGDLALHYYEIGDLASSAKTYGRMRESCTTPLHIITMHLRLINVFIDQKNWNAVQFNVSKIRSPSPKHADPDKVAAKISAAQGIALLRSGNYKEAANSFLDTDPRMISAKLDGPRDEESFSEVLTPNDVAIYGGLCALASMTRDELQKRVLANSSFRNYLELESHIRRAISFFVSSKYSSCLSILDAYKPDYLLDIHLQDHVASLYFQIRNKAIQQYFIPFSSVSLSALASSFNTDEQAIEDEITGMVKRGELNARIDLVDRVLIADTVDRRSQVHEEALAMAKDYERTAHLRILRMEILNAGLEVKGPKAQGGAGNVDTSEGFPNEGARTYTGETSQLRSALRSGGQ